MQRFLSLGTIVASVCAVSFGPFIAQGQITQVIAGHCNHVHDQTFMMPFYALCCPSCSQLLLICINDVSQST